MIVKKNLYNNQMSDSVAVMMLLTLSGGFQDAYTYWVRGEVFANAQTGNIVLMSGYAFSGNWELVGSYMIPVLSFAFGIFFCEVLRYKFNKITNLHWRQIILIVEIILLFVVGCLPLSLNFEANALVSFSCAMQVQSFRHFNGYNYASTMCIGNLRSCMDNLSSWFITKNKSKLKVAFQYFRVILFFAIGSGIGTISSKYIGLSAIWGSCLLLLSCFLLMNEKGYEKN